MTHGGATRTKYKAWDCNLNFRGCSREGKGSGGEGEVAVSHGMFFLDGPWGAVHPCLLPMKPGSAECLAFLFREPSCLLSDPNPRMPFPSLEHECLASCDLGEVSSYTRLLSLRCNNSRVWKTEVVDLFLLLASCASLGKLLSLSELQLLHVHKKGKNSLPHMVVMNMQWTKVQAWYFFCARHYPNALLLLAHLFPIISLREVLSVSPLWGNGDTEML